MTMSSWCSSPRTSDRGPGRRTSQPRMREREEDNVNHSLQDGPLGRTLRRARRPRGGRLSAPPIDLSRGPAPWRMPRPGGDAESYEDSLTGGKVFSMYCNQCHNARALGERPFANYQNMAATSHSPGQLHRGRVREAHGIPAPLARCPATDPARRTISQAADPPPADRRASRRDAPQSQPAAGAQPQPGPAPPAQPGGRGAPPPVGAEALPLPAQRPAGP